MQFSHSNMVWQRGMDGIGGQETFFHSVLVLYPPTVVSLVLFCLLPTDDPILLHYDQYDSKVSKLINCRAREFFTS